MDILKALGRTVRLPVKEDVRQLLRSRDFEKLVLLADKNSSIIRYLFSFLYSTDDLLHWRAAEALGIIANRQYENGINEGRNIPRRLVWSLMEESGSTAWPAPEALGAVVAMRPGAFTVFATIVLSFVDDPVLQRGVLWSARKIAEVRPDIIKDSVPQVVGLLKSSDPTIRGHAAWALGAMRASSAAKELKELQNDPGSLYVYDEGGLLETTVGALAGKSLIEISK